MGRAARKNPFEIFEARGNRNVRCRSWRHAGKRGDREIHVPDEGSIRRHRIVLIYCHSIIYSAQTLFPHPFGPRYRSPFVYGGFTLRYLRVNMLFYSHRTYSIYAKTASHFPPLYVTFHPAATRLAHQSNRSW